MLLSHLFQLTVSILFQHYIIGVSVGICSRLLLPKGNDANPKKKSKSERRLRNKSASKSKKKTSSDNDENEADEGAGGRDASLVLDSLLEFYFFKEQCVYDLTWPAVALPLEDRPFSALSLDWRPVHLYQDGLKKGELRSHDLHQPTPFYLRQKAHWGALGVVHGYKSIGPLTIEEAAAFFEVHRVENVGEFANQQNYDPEHLFVWDFTGNLSIFSVEIPFIGNGQKWIRFKWANAS